jgi:hypothetical protein
LATEVREKEKASNEKAAESRKDEKKAIES